MVLYVLWVKNFITFESFLYIYIIFYDTRNLLKPIAACLLNTKLNKYCIHTIDRKKR